MEKVTGYDILIDRDNNKVIKISVESEILREYNNILSLPESDFYYKDAEIHELSFNLESLFGEKEAKNTRMYSEKIGEPLLELHIRLVKGKTFHQILDGFRIRNKNINLPIIKKDIFILLLKRLTDLYFKVKDLNAKLFFHNDLNYNNIILEDDNFVLIDFRELTTINPQCLECESDLDAILNHIKDLIRLGRSNLEIFNWIDKNNLKYYINEENIPLLYQFLCQE